MVTVKLKTYSKTCDVFSLTNEQIKELRECTLRDQGLMEWTLRSILEKNKGPYGLISSSKAIVHYADQEHTELVGWGLCFLTPNNPWRIHIFVYPDYRREGVATKILKQVRRNLKLPHLMIYGWDAQAQAFANSFD